MSIRKPGRQYLVAVVVLILIFGGVWYVTTHLRPPGSMTVLEAQGMSSVQAEGPAGAAPVAVEVARKTVFAPAVTYTGSVTALNDEDVYPRVTGTLTSILVYPGDHVSAGQVVARLDSVELTSRTREASSAQQAALQDVGISSQQRELALSQQRASQAKVLSIEGGLRDAIAQIDAARDMQAEAGQNVDAAVASLGDAEANITVMEADAEYWSHELARETVLYRAGAVSKDEYQQEISKEKGAQAKLAQAEAGVTEKKAMVAASRAKSRQAHASLTGAQARADQVRADRQGARADLNASAANVEVTNHQIRQKTAMADQAIAQHRTAGIIRDYTEIRAQQAGTVTERLASPGTLVQPGMAILRIKNSTQVRLQANVSEADLGGVHIGNAIKVKTDSVPPFAFTAHVTSLFAAANTESRTVIVEARVPNPGNRLIPGQYVTMEIATDTAKPQISVPLIAVHRAIDQKPFVWLASRSTESRPSSDAMPGMSMPTKVSPTSHTKVLLAHRVFVTLGAGDGNRVVVLAGLSDGSAVIYKGNEYLSEGDLVAPTAWANDGPAELPKPSATQMPPMPGMSGAPGETPGSAVKGTSMPGMPGM